MAAPIRTLCCAAFRQSRRGFTTTCTTQAGIKWRAENGLALRGSEYGPLTDLPDWSFADGRLAPPLKGQLRRKQEREALARRVVALSSEVDKGMEAWRDKNDKAKKMEEYRTSRLFKPKGKLLLKKNK
ncbi:hypothetical protein DPEC_G00104930 [Dallia pectoralis]|uniref:Uncharacterized protein n=1 Tax=Dallia pectoralis TaxID=75939 RepID=A0ACC2GXV6_DALPE|nr:hypothetical protein DPEC_G00104930 [Dallia pectoralis]